MTACRTWRCRLSPCTIMRSIHHLCVPIVTHGQIYCKATQVRQLPPCTAQVLGMTCSCQLRM